MTLVMSSSRLLAQQAVEVEGGEVYQRSYALTYGEQAVEVDVEMTLDPEVDLYSVALRTPFERATLEVFDDIRQAVLDHLSEEGIA